MQEYTGKECNNIDVYRFRYATPIKKTYYMYMRDRERERERGEWMRMVIIKQ